MAAALAVVLVASGCARPVARAEPLLPPIVEVVRATSPASTATILASGRIERRHEAELSFPMPGVLTQLSVQAGDRVHAGQVLATLDATGLEAVRRRALADLDRARREAARSGTLFEKGFVSRQRVDDGETTLRAAQAAYDGAAFDGRWARLVSPINGVVLQRRSQSGEVVAAGQSVVRVADEASPFVLRAQVPDGDVAYISRSGAAYVTVTNGDEIAGRIAHFGQSTNLRTSTVEIEVELPAGSPVRSGQVARVTFRRAPPQGALKPVLTARIPAEGMLDIQEADATLFVIEDGSSVARRRKVRFLGFDGDQAVVTGLRPGQRVITAGAAFVHDGDTVRVVEKRAVEAVVGGAAGGRG